MQLNKHLNKYLNNLYKQDADYLVEYFFNSSSFFYNEAVESDFNYFIDLLESHYSNKKIIKIL